MVATYRNDPFLLIRVRSPAAHSTLFAISTSSRGRIRADSHQHLTDVVAFKKTDERLGGALDPLKDRLPPFHLSSCNPGHHVRIELRQPVIVVRDDVALEGGPFGDDKSEV